MTKRLIEFEGNGVYQIPSSWPDIATLFDGVRTMEQFESVVEKAESFYGSELIPLETMPGLPTVEETWILADGHLSKTHK